MIRMEVLVDAIADMHECFRPDSDAYRLRNPMLLKSFAVPGKHEIDELGRRKFDSFLGGYRAAVYDVKLKITGESSTGLKPSDKLKNLLSVYGINQQHDQIQIVSFLRKALINKDIDLSTPLSYFIE